ncbi:hypothetical protein KAW50_01925 [candidate division WOR-3 bacterium]|nr:hypothetical protein [candidate division WOR-3 bacterium]
MWLLFLINLIRVEGFTNSQGAVLDFAIPKFEEHEKLKEGIKFVDLSIEDAGIIYDVGKPKLPVIRKFIEIPEGANVSLEVTVEVQYIEPLQYPVYPNQPPWLKIQGYRPEFTWDRDYYERDEFLPQERARITEIGEIRGHRIALLEIYPVSYNPARNIIRFAEALQVKIKWNGANWGATYAKLNRYSSPIYDHRLKDIIVNYDYYETLNPKPSTPISYLIITPDSWESAITPLAEWKRQKGYYVKVASLSEVGGGDTTAVRNYIKEAYDTCTVPPSFVLLVGDVDSIGHFIGGTLNNPSTDLYYGTMDTGNYFPDIDVSRLSVTSETELEELIEKTIRYEKNQWTQGTDWCNKGYFIASDDGNNHETAEGTHSYCMEKCRAYGMICDSLWGFGGTGTPITTALNEGRSWVMYSGHGSITSWQGPYFSTTGVHNLSNLDKAPFVGTFACKSGRYQVAECFSESWIRSGYNGAIADFASSVYSYWEEDDILQRKMFDAVFDSEFTWTMGIINKSKLLFYEYYGDFTPMGSTRRYFEMYNLMGDGSIDIYWDTPHPITVLYSSVIPIGYYDLEVTVKDGDSAVKGALVCAKRDTIFSTGFYETGYTNSSGIATITLHNLAPCTLQITVTGHNLETYIGDCEVISVDFYVMYKSHLIDDSAGNGDGYVNPGESIKLWVVLKNIGTETSYGVESALSTFDSFVVALSDTVQNYGNIASCDTALSSGAYRFTVGAGCPNGHIIPFGLRITDDSSNVWIDSIHIAVGVPFIAYKEYEIDDSSAQNPNGYWESGETTDLIVTLENKGVGDATDISAKLCTDNSYVTVIDSSVNFGNIPTGKLNVGSPYRVFLHPSTPIGENVDFELHITGMSWEWTDSFTVQTGPPGVMFADHNIGNIKFTVTCQGICGKESVSSAGSGFCYPNPGTNWLNIGSLWVGNSVDYVVNRDYGGEGPGDWKVTLNPDGKLRMGDKKYSDQDGWARYDDSGHSSPCGITITQKSWAWQDTSYSDFVIMQYTLKNNGSSPVNGLFVGQFMDFDLDEWSSSDNNVGTDSTRRLVYQWSNSHAEYVGVSVLNPTFASNLSAISYSNYISPQGYILDSLKIKFLNGTLSFPSSDSARDWSVVASTGPFDLEVGEDTVIAVAILGGDSLNDLKYNADMAQKKYDSLMEGEEDLRVTIDDFRLTIYPNPFIKRTIIRLRFPYLPNLPTTNREYVSLKIYDLAGRLIKEFPIHEPRTTNHEVVWDGKDSHNKKLSSGVYFCRLEYGDLFRHGMGREYRKVRKLILLR